MAQHDTAERIRRVESGLIRQQDAALPDPPRCALAERMEYYRVPGVSIAVIHDGQIDWARGCGVLEKGKPEPVNPDTLFQAASISKPVAAVAIMRLVQNGLLDLDEDVNAYLKSWRVPPVNGWQPRLTLRQLLSHTAGLTVHGFLGYAHDAPLPTLTQVLDGVKPANSDPVRVDTLPGAQFRYSGGGTSIAQQVVMDVTGRSFDDVARELVFEPLGMTRSRYEHPLTQPHRDNAARGHLYNGQLVEGRWFTHPELAAAGLWTTPGDLARFALELQLTRGGKAGKVLSAESFNQMLVPHGDVTMLEPGAAISIGFFLQKGRFGHGGSNVGFRCKLTAYQDAGFGAAIMTNGDQGYELCGEIEYAIAGEYGWPDFFPPTAAIPDLNAVHDAACVGEYELKPGLRFSVTLTDGKLQLQPGSQPPLELRALPDGEYTLHDLKAAVKFVKGDDGQIAHLVFKQNGQEMTAPRL